MTAPVREGEVIAGKYRVDKILGVGGMGVVVAAHHIQLDDKVAIKFLLPEALGSQETVARFAREAQAAVRIKSEHVARVSDVGKLENGSPYMVMEYLEGSDLSSWIRERGFLPVEQAVEFMLQTCEAIADAHALGIIHRDLKPANLFVIRRSDGLYAVKVLDFGISKVTNPAAPEGEMTRTSAVMGSPLYMSPEQMQSTRDVDARTDIWSLGVILYELLAGKTPFVADTMAELVVRVLSAPPPPLREVRPDLPARIEDVVRKCLEKERAKRYPNVAELAQALADFAPPRSRGSIDRIIRVIQNAGLSSTVNAAPASPPDPSAKSADTLGEFSRTGTKSPSQSRFKGAAVALGVLAVSGAVLVGRRGAESSERSAAGAPQVSAAMPAPVPSAQSLLSTPPVAPQPSVQPVTNASPPAAPPSVSLVASGAAVVGHAPAGHAPPKKSKAAAAPSAPLQKPVAGSSLGGRM